MSDSIPDIDKKTNRLYISNATTVFSILLLIVICRLEFPGKRIFIAMYLFTILSYTVILYNDKMPRFLRFTQAPHDPLLLPAAYDDSANHVQIHDQHQIPLERRLLLHDF